MGGRISQSELCEVTRSGQEEGQTMPAVGKLFAPSLLASGPVGPVQVNHPARAVRQLGDGMEPLSRWMAQASQEHLASPARGVG